MNDLTFNRALSGYFVTTKDEAGETETRVYPNEADAKHYAREFMARLGAASAKIDLFDHGDYLGSIWQSP